MRHNPLIVGGTTAGGIGEHLQWNLHNREPFVPAPAELDVTDQESINRYAQERARQIDTLYYCAGVSDLRWIKDTELQDMQRVFSVNVFGLVALTGALLTAGHPLSRVVALVSDASETPMRGSVAYTSSKAAEAMAVRTMARELAPLTVVVGVSPGVVEGTPMTRAIDEGVPAFRGWTPEQSSSYANAGLVMRRRVTKQEVVDTMLFAASGPATLNGSIITINGGK